MKFVASFLLLWLSFPSGGQININNGLIACYPFYGNAIDQTGNNHDGTVFGSMLTTDRFGIAQSAYAFDGINDYIDIGSFSTFTPSNDFSISVWIQPNQVKLQTILMLQPDDFNDRFNAMAYYSHNGISSTIWDFGDCTAGGRLMQMGTIFSNSWQHYVFTVSASGGMKVYKNGVLTNTLPTSSQVIDRLRNLWIGGGVDSNGAQFYFDGKIDDMRLYDRELNSAEAQVLYGIEMICQSTAVPEQSTVQNDYSVTTRNGMLVIKSLPFSETSAVTIFSAKGAAIIHQMKLKAGETLEIPLPTSGLLLYSIRTITKSITGKIVSVF